jgi:arsenate reductase
MLLERINILVLCTGNSARSVMAEAIFNTLGNTRFRASSAGSRPIGSINPLALEQIEARGWPAQTYRSKSWREFTREDAPHIDIVLTVCDGAADETCPAFPGDWSHVHWGLPDPAAIDDVGSARKAFAACFSTLTTRVESLLQRPAGRYGKADIVNAMRQFKTRPLTSSRRISR